MKLNESKTQCANVAILSTMLYIREKKAGMEGRWEERKDEREGRGSSRRVRSTPESLNSA
jgi:hypothetical protein